MRLALFLLLAYVLQTTVFGSLWLKPDLFLLLVIVLSPGGVGLGSIYWLVTGVFLDLFNGFSFFYTLTYVLCGLIFGFIPKDIFRDRVSLDILQVVLGTLILQIGYTGLSKLFLKTVLMMPWYMIILQVFFNLFCYLLIYFLFLRDRRE